MILPTIHLNGTAPEDLLRKFEEATRALDKAMEALQAAAPHGRDYYPQNSEFGAEVFLVAQREHIERQMAIKRVYNDIENLAWHVQDAIDQRAKQRAVSR